MQEPHAQEVVSVSPLISIEFIEFFSRCCALMLLRCLVLGEIPCIMNAESITRLALVSLFNEILPNGHR